MATEQKPHYHGNFNNEGLFDASDGPTPIPNSTKDPSLTVGVHDAADEALVTEMFGTSGINTSTREIESDTRTLFQRVSEPMRRGVDHVLGRATQAESVKKTLPLDPKFVKSNGSFS